MFLNTNISESLSYIFKYEIYINLTIKYDFENYVKSIRTIILNNYITHPYKSILLILLNTFSSINNISDIRNRKSFLKKFLSLINTINNKYYNELPFKVEINPVSYIIEEYLNTNCGICNKYGDYQFFNDKTLNLDICLCYNCAKYEICKLCDNKCLFFLDCQKCKKLYCIPCSLNKTKSTNCLKCQTCSICIDVFRECKCLNE